MNDKEESPSHTPGTGKGEEHASGQEAGREDTGTNPAGRETGKSTARDYTDINPQDPIDPDSPTLVPS